MSRFRSISGVHVARSCTRCERYDPKIIRVDVELSHETNRRQSKTCQRVQITLASRGPAIRAEASAERSMPRWTRR